MASLKDSIQNNISHGQDGFIHTVSDVQRSPWTQYTGLPANIRGPCSRPRNSDGKSRELGTYGPFPVLPL